MLLTALICLASLAPSWSLSQPAAAKEQPLIFEKDIQSILNRHCVSCHGLSKQSGGLRLDGYEHLAAGGKKGVVIEIGKSGDSLLVELIEAEGKKRMPPKGDLLPAESVQLIRKWIDSGARSDPTLKQEAPSLTLGDLPVGFEPVLALAGDREGKLLAMGRGETVVIVPLQGDALVILKGHRDVVQCLQFSPDGKILASGAFQEIILWDAASWTEWKRLSPHRDRVLAVSFSPDGNLLASGGGEPSMNGELKIWEVPTGKLMLALPEAHADSIFSLCFHPNGQTIATGAGDRLVQIFDIASGKRQARFEGHTHHVLGVAFSPDGKRLLSAGADGKIKHWNLENNTKINDWNGHSKGVMAISYSPDGKLAASVSGDRSLKIWNAENGGPLNSFADSKDYLYSLSIFGNGKFIATGGRDQNVRIYDLKDNKLIRAIEPAKK